MTTGIDREALVRRHRIVRSAPDALEPLTVGNGELAYTADVTGMQTLHRLHDAVAGRRAGRAVMPLSTQSQWGFHEMPNPHGWSLADVEQPWPTPRGDVPYPTDYDFRHEPPHLRDDERAGWFLWTNPQRLDLARIGLAVAGAPADEDPDIADVHQVLDPWTGVLESRFHLGGELVEVTTACHPDQDVLAFRIRSSLLAERRLGVELAFPYASETFADTADWSRPEAHTTQAVALGHGTTRFDRTLDTTRYGVRVATTGEPPRATGPHRFALQAAGDALELVVAFDRATGSTQPLPTSAQVVAASAAGWERFWRSGAAVDLGEADDPRAAELERRIVLSQYVTRVHCAGSTPSAETGLTQNSWAGKFHLEMHWWHAAHFAMWGRPELLEQSFAWYLDDLPVARAIARRQGFRGARWPKHVGPEGRESPNAVGPLLLWQQPHPIHFAELLRLARPDREAEVLDRWGEIVDATAEFLVSFLWRGQDGLVHLPPSLMPAQERYDPRDVWDPTFELAYVAWALETAQRWRERRGMARDDEADRLLADLAPLPTADGRYAAIGNPPRTIPSDHPSMLGALGVVPGTRLVDPATMAATLRWVIDEWRWESAWGWDFPMLAMTATRLREPELAIDVLLMDQHRNRYLANGHNCQDPLRLPLYLPGNGGLLAAVALMAAGWTGEDTPHPGFPDDWRIRAEGFAPRP